MACSFSVKLNLAILPMNDMNYLTRHCHLLADSLSLLQNFRQCDFLHVLYPSIVAYQKNYVAQTMEMLDAQEMMLIIQTLEC